MLRTHTTRDLGYVLCNLKLYPCKTPAKGSPAPWVKSSMTLLIPLGIPVYLPCIADVGMVNEHTWQNGLPLALGVSCQQRGGSRTSSNQLNGKKCRKFPLKAGKLPRGILGAVSTSDTLAFINNSDYFKRLLDKFLATLRPTGFC